MEEAHPKVFISYSHDSPAHIARVLEFSDRLRADGIDSMLDQYEVAPPEGFPLWMERQIEEADFVLLICTPTYYLRVMRKEREGIGRGVAWEGNLIYQYIYEAATMNNKFIPILLEGAREADIPTPCRGLAYYRPSTNAGHEALYRRLTNQPATPKTVLGVLRQLPPLERKVSASPTTSGKDEFTDPVDTSKSTPSNVVGTQQQFGSYQLITLLNVEKSGQNVLSKSYLAKHIPSGKNLAIQILNTQLRGTESRQFLSEVQVLVSLKHPNIVPVIDGDLERGTPFLVMDYPLYNSLRDYHPQGDPHQYSNIAFYIVQVAEALYYAHRQNILHRNIKPESILLGVNQDALLTNFRIPIIAHHMQRFTVQSIYTAPEQRTNQVFPASDQYALGAVVYEFLTGEQPTDITLSSIEAASRHDTIYPSVLRAKHHTISIAIEKVLLKALAKEPGSRYTSVLEFANALNDALR